MSETPRDEGEPEFRDPTAPIDTSRTQPVPPTGEVPPPGPPPGAPAPGGPAYGAPPASPPRNPFASPTEGAPQSPYAGPPAGAAPQPVYGSPYPPPPPSPGGYGAPSAGTPGYGPPAYGPPGYGGTPGYGAPGYGGPYAPSHSVRGATIALLVVSGLASLFLWGIPALILGIIAAARKDEPSTSANLTRWGWIALVVCFVLAILMAFLLGALVTSFTTNNSFSTGA